jgi:hypothetical protein
MAESHSTRRKAKSSRLRPDGRRRSARRLHVQTQRASSTRSSRGRSTTPTLAHSDVHLISQLREVSQLLSVIYSTCVTAELALQGQNADRDRDILITLRMHVSEPVSRQVENLSSLILQLGGEATETRP